MRAMRRSPFLLFSGRRFLVVTAALCGAWLLMDALLFYSGPSSALRSADRIRKDKPQARNHRLLEEYAADGGKLTSSSKGDGFNRQGAVLGMERQADKERGRDEDPREKFQRRDSRLAETVEGNRDLLPSNGEKLQRAFEVPKANDFPGLQNLLPVIQFDKSERDSLAGFVNVNSKNFEKLAETVEPGGSLPNQAPLAQRDWNSLATAKPSIDNVLQALDDGGKSAGNRVLGVLEEADLEEQRSTRQTPEIAEPEVKDAGIIKKSQSDGKLDLKSTQKAIWNPSEASVIEKQQNLQKPEQSVISKDAIIRRDNNDTQRNENLQDSEKKGTTLSPVSMPHSMEKAGPAKKAQASAKKTWKRASRESPPTDGSVRIRDFNVRMLPFDDNGAGEGGAPVPTSITEQKRVEAMWSLSYFNQLTTDKISVERSIPDTRHPLCREKRYNYSLLPRVSVIICFTDEWWSALVRSVHSVLDRTPPEILEEIILLDDFSQRPDLKDSLGSYLAGYSKVRLIHLPERHGLIRARMVGVEASKGKVIVFLDSHVEVNRGWIEPLLEVVRRNRKSVVSPTIDGIDAMDFRYKRAPDTIRGGFSWNLQFQWRVIPNYEMKRRRGDPTAPIRTPTIAGGLFAVERDYFLEIGEYDPGLDVWGAENLELSFKTWMCGGSMEIAPCSRVGHIFRSAHPYSFPGKTETLLRNNMRVAKVRVKHK